MSIDTVVGHTDISGMAEIQSEVWKDRREIIV
jgi:hypothetical protein